METLLPDLLSTKHGDLNKDQQRALKILNGQSNVFITGGAGTGKSYLLKKFLGDMDATKVPVLASTGAAAVLIGGRTFHSFFGLGIMEGGPQATIDRAIQDKRVIKRMKKAHTIVLDEISMIPGIVLQVAEEIARLCRGNSQVWGGIRMITVGDFAQLPPISKFSSHRDWAFLSPTWEQSEFQSIELNEIMRAKNDFEFCEILSELRRGHVSQRLKNLLESRLTTTLECDFEGSVLYARKNDVERVNLSKLQLLDGELHTFETQYMGDDRFLKSLIQNAPIPQSLQLKVGAFVMLRQNDPIGRWVNGSLGHIKKIDKETLEIRLLGGSRIEIEPASFTMLDAEGREVATAKNFPVNLAYAMTIHKAQGATMDSIVVKLKGLWEPGQAYVALSRVRSSNGLMVEEWDTKSLMSDPQVLNFYNNFS